MKSKTTAGLLAIFLGGLGFHKFYLGQTGWGILYILFCWTRIPSIIWVFEGISILTHSDDWRNDKYNDGKDASGKDLYDQLLKFDQLKEKGLIDAEEYEEKVKEIKAKINAKKPKKEEPAKEEKPEHKKEPKKEHKAKK